MLRNALPLHRLRERLDYNEACALAPGRFIDLPSGRCHYEEVGEGPPVLLVHGFLYSSFEWAPVMAQIGAAHRALAVDLFGWGYSERDERRLYDYVLYANQLLELMDALEIERAALIGQSMGGGTAIRFAVEHPDRVERLVLVDAASLPNPTPLVGRIFALPMVGELLLTTGGNAMIGRQLKDFWFYDKRHVTPEYVDRVARPLRIKGSSWTALAILRHLDFGSQEDLVTRLAGVDCPKLIVWGRQDKAVPLALGERMHEMLPGSELLILDEAGHTPHEEQPDEFLERVMPFLAGP